MSDLLYESQYFTTTLSVAGGIDASQTTGIVFQVVTEVSEPTKPGLVLLSYSDPLNTTASEWITYTSINTTTKELAGVHRAQEGSSGKAHANGVTVAFPHSMAHINRINDKLTGVDSGVTLDSPTIVSPTLTSPTITGTALASADGLNVSSLSRQAIINGGFTVNQRVYVSNATLAAGAYGHDRWKAGASGGDYTFTQLPQSTQITIKTGKSLIQVVEDKNVIGGTYTLSWTGTAQARFGKDSATPSGTYAASPITITGQTAGTVMSVEFNEGTLKDVQLNSGSVPLPFQPKSFEEELRACQWYYRKSYNYSAAPGSALSTGIGVYFIQSASDASRLRGSITFPTMRATPILRFWDAAGNLSKVTSVSGDTFTDNQAINQLTSNSDNNLFYTSTSGGFEVAYDLNSEL